MTRPRALVLHNGKAAFDEARAPFAREIEFLDLHEAATAPAGAHEVPAFAPERATLAVIDGLLARFPFRHVVTTSESNTAFAAFLRSRYGLAGPRYDQVLPATSKWRMKQQWGHAFPSARCWLPGDFRALATQGRAPAEVVVKPLAGFVDQGVRRLGRQECLDHLAATGELVVVEEAIDLTSELHCDGVVRDGKPRVIVPSVYNRPPLGSAGHNLASIHLPVGDPAGARRSRPPAACSPRSTCRISCSTWNCWKAMAQCASVRSASALPARGAPRHCCASTASTCGPSTSPRSWNYHDRRGTASQLPRGTAG